MIFFSVGTERFPFDRLVRAADSVQESLKEEPVFVQLGQSSWVPHYCKWTAFLSYKELVERIVQARIVVMHAGVGSLLLCVQHGKIPIMIPRRKQFGEHVDDHQVELAMKMAERGYLLLAEEPKDILPLILEYEKRKPARPAVSSSSLRLSGALVQYLESSDSGKNHP